MTKTFSVKDGGLLCSCGHMKCQHESGTGACDKCKTFAERGEMSRPCTLFIRRAERAA